MNYEEKILAALEQMNNRISGVEQGQNTTNAWLSAMQTDIVELKADVSVVKGDIFELKTDVSVVKGDIFELKADVSMMKEDIEEIKEAATETRYSVNQIGKWAERVGPKIDIGIYDD